MSEHDSALRCAPRLPIEAPPGANAAATMLYAQRPIFQQLV